MSSTKQQTLHPLKFCTNTVSTLILLTNILIEVGYNLNAENNYSLTAPSLIISPA